jgi:hypothetical protein
MEGSETNPGNANNFAGNLTVGQMVQLVIGTGSKRPGRPATGRDPVLTVRLPPALRSAIETWAKQQKDTPSRSEAIRRLIEAGLARKAKRQR